VLKRQVVKRELDSLYEDGEDEEMVSPVIKQATRLRRDNGGAARRSKTRGSKAVKDKMTSENTSALKESIFTD